VDCAVCHQPLTRSSWRLGDGRHWCDRHAGAPTCRFCGFPLTTSAAPASATDPDRCCADCDRTRVHGPEALAEHRRLLRAHMDGLGLLLPAPTRIRLVPAAELARGAAPGARAPLGETRWAWSRRRLSGPVTIRVVSGLPGHLFRRTLAHEFGHAAVVGARRGREIPVEILEGFAECVALEHLRWLRDPYAVTQAQLLLDNPDPVYGGGLRLVRPWVESTGLVAVAAALRAGDLPVLALRTG
jgi:hypothetical protein